MSSLGLGLLVLTACASGDAAPWPDPPPADHAAEAAAVGCSGVEVTLSSSGDTGPVAAFEDRRAHRDPATGVETLCLEIRPDSVTEFRVVPRSRGTYSLRARCPACEWQPAEVLLEHVPSTPQVLHHYRVEVRGSPFDRFEVVQVLSPRATAGVVPTSSESVLAVSVASSQGGRAPPVYVLLRDSEGRRAGQDGDGATYSEVPGSHVLPRREVHDEDWEALEVEPAVEVRGSPGGEMALELHAVSDGSYTLRVVGVASNDAARLTAATTQPTAIQADSVHRYRLLFTADSGVVRVERVVD